MSWSRAGIPHLPLQVLDATAWVGPLVLPGRTACLRCVDAHRRDRDPAWPSVAAQLTAAPPAGDPGVDGALAAAAAAHAALAALDHLDATALGGRAELAGRGLVLRLPGGPPPAPVVATPRLLRVPMGPRRPDNGRVTPPPPRSAGRP